ncbi:MAG TPA: TldD/PmbA family protein [candidate division Zixibacteria bacterium]|nr:TldD/PmbA family protein [candidate division Zixibacteria bacterium]
MIGKDRLFTTLEKVMADSKADQTEAVFLGSSVGLTRFANSHIHQNVAETNTTVYFRVAMGKKLGVASTTSMSLTDLRRCLRAATDIAKRQVENRHFDQFPGQQDYPEVETFFEKTAKFSPRQRATKLKRIFTKTINNNLDAAGAFSTGEGEVAVLNSNGLRCYQPYTTASGNIVIMGDDSSGYVNFVSHNIDDLDFTALSNTALKKCKKSKNPKEIEPGRYEVILEPAAVANLLEWMNFIAFGSKAFQEETSCLAGRIGEQIMGSNISIFDDALNPAGVPFPFDLEGVAKKGVEFVADGVARGVVYDTISGNKENKQSTGHALMPSESGEGAMPLNVFIKPGDSSLEQMISNVEKGILVTRFHYINGFLDTRKALMTGMTRDGTFLINNGKLSNGIKNLRFTDSMLDVFSNVAEISSESVSIPGWWDAMGCNHVPAMRVSEFNFSGKTDF